MTDSQFLRPLNVIFIGDSGKDAELIDSALTAGAFAPLIERVDCARSLKAALAALRWDVILCDYVLTGLNLEDAHRVVREHDEAVPFLVLYSALNEDDTPLIFRAGATAAIVKENIKGHLVPEVTRELAAAEIRRALGKSEVELNARNEQFSAIMTNIPGLVYRRVLQADGSVTFTALAGALVAELGLNAGQLAQTNLNEFIHSDDKPALDAGIQRSAEELSPFAYEARLVLPSGDIRWIASHSRPVRRTDGSTTWDVVSVDITEQRRARERVQFLQNAMLAVAKADDYASALRVVLSQVCAATGWAIGLAWVPDADGSSLSIEAAWHTQEPDWALSLENARPVVHTRDPGFVGEVWQTREPLSEAGDLWERDAESEKWPHGCRTRARYAAPVCIDADVLAIFEFRADRHHDADTDFTNLIGAITSQVKSLLLRKRMSRELRQTIVQLEAAQEAAELGRWTADDWTLQWSREMFLIFGVQEGTFELNFNSLLSLIHLDDRDRFLAYRKLSIDQGSQYQIDFRIIRPDGTICWIHSRAKIERDAAGRMQRLIGVVQNISRARAAQDQILHAQKMEAIGALTGGMAHDFNNVLATIIGNLDLAVPLLDADSRAAQIATNALDAALRGGDLTQRLLAFARRQPLLPSRTDVNRLIAELMKLLQPLIEAHIEIALKLAGDLWPVNVDRVQLEAIIVNLATNARDAMPNGGRLTLLTRNCQLDSAHVAENPELAAGDYAVIEVSDNGSGIPPEDIARVFEPYFTTKREGRGTGLGLSMVFGFIQQSGGHIEVASDAGVGTTFRLYLPREFGDRTPIVETAQGFVPGGTGETILAVEDDPSVRETVALLLIKLGYRALVAGDAWEALDILREEQVDVLFTDIMLPGGKDGLELLREVMIDRPYLKVLVTSGFVSVQYEPETLGCGVRLLRKPYRLDELGRTLHDVLTVDHGFNPSHALS